MYVYAKIAQSCYNFFKSKEEIIFLKGQRAQLRSQVDRKYKRGYTRLGEAEKEQRPINSRRLEKQELW